MIVSFLVKLFLVSGLILLLALNLFPTYFLQVAVKSKQQPQTTSTAPQQTTPSSNNDSINIDVATTAQFSQKGGSSECKIDLEDLNNPRILLLVVNEKTFTVALSSSQRTYIHAKALEFCIENQLFLAMNKEDLRERCVPAILSFIEEDIRKSNGSLAVFFEGMEDPIEEQRLFPPGQHAVQTAEDVYKVKLPFNNGRTYVLRLEARHSSPRKVATEFCRVKAEEFSLRSEEDILTRCVPVVEQHIITEVTKIRRPSSADGATDLPNNTEESQENIENTSSSSTTMTNDNKQQLEQEQQVDEQQLQQQQEQEPQEPLPAHRDEEQQDEQQQSSAHGEQQQGEELSSSSSEGEEALAVNDVEEVEAVAVAVVEGQSQSEELSEEDATSLLEADSLQAEQSSAEEASTAVNVVEEEGNNNNEDSGKVMLTGEMGDDADNTAPN